MYHVQIGTHRIKYKHNIIIHQLRFGVTSRQFSFSSKKFNSLDSKRTNSHTDCCFFLLCFATKSALNKHNSSWVWNNPNCTKAFNPHTSQTFSVTSNLFLSLQIFNCSVGFINEQILTAVFTLFCHKLCIDQAPFITDYTGNDEKKKKKLMKLYHLVLFGWKLCTIRSQFSVIQNNGLW